QQNHLHFLVEIEDESALSHGMKGLLVRVARSLNRLWGRQGAVFADRYHARALRSPREVRTALVYVLQNARKHRAAVGETDSFSSAAWFEGWEHPPGSFDSSRCIGRAPVVAARSWLLRAGWQRHGLIF